ncbi:MAG: co-chaperone YbbN [Pseudomonadota bacterium]
MLGFGSSGAEAPADDLIKDVTDQTFMADVIEASRETPVIVDFWAPWCGPCKQLGPVLEQAVREAGGKVKLAKVDVDKSPMVAGQLQVQSIPAVFAFVGGQPLDGFMGALPAGQIKQFIDQVIRAAGPDARDEAIAEHLEAAEQALAAKDLATAAQTFAAILKAEPTELRAIGGLARVYAASGDFDRARQTLSLAPPEKAEDPALATARAAIELAEQSAGAAKDLARHRAALSANADDHQARFDLALALVAVGEQGAAIDELLEIFRRDRMWNEEAAKTQLMKLFEALGPKDPLTLSGRRRLSSMIFA